jgi:hypothetical protein
MPEITSPSAIDLTALKGRQQAAWSAGDYAVVGTTLQIVGETLCEALDLRTGERVLDIAAGNGNATLAAARRGADVTSTRAWARQGERRAPDGTVRGGGRREPAACRSPWPNGSTAQPMVHWLPPASTPRSSSSAGDRSRRPVIS